MSLLETMRERRAAKKAELDGLLQTAEAREEKSMTDDEAAKFDSLVDEIRKDDERIDELSQLAVREAAAAEVRKESGVSAVAKATVKDPPIYTRDGETGNSYFRDLANATVHGSGAARDRLMRSSRMAADESRALGNTGAAGGSGGEFAPPLWAVDEFIALARPARVFANLVNNMPLPAGVSSVNLPKISGGTTTAVQTTQNSALSQTDMTTTSVSANITTIGGKQVVSMQLLEQSAIPFDRVILQDLAADYARALDIQFILGTGSSGQLRGVVNGASAGSYTYTQATPAVGGAGGFYAKLAGAVAQMLTTRYLPPTAIVMHPRRWAFVAASFDTQNRPLLPVGSPSFNSVGVDDPAVMAQGYVGTMQGLPVYVDPNIPINLGAGTNEDRVFVVRLQDLWLYESALQMQAFDQTYADSAGILFRALAYSAAIPDRYGASIQIISGTGLVTPSF